MLNEIWRVSDTSLLVTFRDKGDGPPLFSVHGGGGGVMYVRDVMQDLRCRNPVYGLHAPPLDGSARLPRGIEKFAARYIREIRKLQPSGPYNIIGFSAGGTIAYEMACQLRRSGETVALLGVIETNAARYKTGATPADVPPPITVKKGGPIMAAKRFYWATPKVIARMPKVIKRIKYVAPNNIRHALGLAIPHDERDQFYMRRFIEAESVYAPHPYPGTVTLFTRKHTADYFHALWAGLAGGGLIIHELPVDQHLAIVALPTSRFLAAQIDTGLNADQSDPGL
jgi:pimeloyl-ACP methyl ester carboxylesterase